MESESSQIQNPFEMDNLTRVIAEYAAGLSFDELPAEVRTAAMHRMVDTHKA